MSVPTTKKRNFSILIILLLLIAIGYLGYFISKLNNLNHDISKEISGLIEENKEMNQILINEQVFSDSKNNDLKSNLKLMLQSYDSLEQSNTMVLDSIDIQRNKIQDLMNKVEKLNTKSKRNWREIYKLQKEAETLRGIMKGYIQTIDSLNTLNVNLSNTLTEKNKTLNKVNKQNEQFKEENQALQDKVAIGAVLQAGNINVSAIRIRSSGNQSETTRASKTNMIKTCCSLIENKLTPTGDKTIYIKVIDNNNTVLKSKEPIIIKTSTNENADMSAKRTINYQNETTDICVYYDILEPIGSGNFKVELYSEGYLIGKSSFALR